MCVFVCMCVCVCGPMLCIELPVLYTGNIGKTIKQQNCSQGQGGHNRGWSHGPGQNTRGGFKN